MEKDQQGNPTVSTHYAICICYLEYLSVMGGFVYQEVGDSTQKCFWILVPYVSISLKGNGHLSVYEGIQS